MKLFFFNISHYFYGFPAQHVLNSFRENFCLSHKEDKSCMFHQMKSFHSVKRHVLKVEYQMPTAN